MNISYFTPEIIVFVGACILLLMSVFPIPNKRVVLGVAAFVVPLLALVALIKDMPNFTILLPAGSMVMRDATSNFSRILLLLISFPVLLSSFDMFTDQSKRQGEFLFLMLLSVGSLMIMVQATNLIVLFLSIEGASIPLYMIAGLRAGDERSKEAVVKYFILGAFASAITIYGVSLVFSVAHSFDFAAISKVIIDSHLPVNTMLVGFILVICGLAFKVAAVPFHFWAPDVYEGSPPISTAFISVAPKIGALIALSRFVGFAMPAFPLFHDIIMYVLMGISVASMTYGNITALLQTEVKRIMAYSSIAQIGYMLISVVVMTMIATNPDVNLKAEAVRGIMMYVSAYALMNISVFSIIKVVEKEKGGSTLNHFKGLSKTHPVLALCMLIALVSLLGIPFTAGFFGKFLVFSAAVSGSIVWIVIVAVLNSALSAFYYFNIVKSMYIDAPETEASDMNYLKNPATISSICCTILTLVIGLVPAVYRALEWASKGFGS